MSTFKKRLLRGAAAIGAALAAGTLSAVPAFSADNGTVNARVVAGVAPCITITSPAGGGNVDFASLAFSTGTQPQRWPGTPDITVQNCGTSSETFLAKGTIATGPNAQWSLEQLPLSCPNQGIDRYNLLLRDTNNGDLFLDDLANQTLGGVNANGALTRNPRIVMPCSGSSGNGVTMSMSYIFTATTP